MQTHSSGQAALISVTLVLALSLAIIAAFSTTALVQAGVARDILYSKQAWFAAESVLEDQALLLRRGEEPPSAPYAISYDAQDVAITVTTTDEGGGTTRYAAKALRSSVIRKSAFAAVGGSVRFPYAVQAGDGSITMNNDASISHGSVHSDRDILSNSNNTKIIEILHFNNPEYRITAGGIIDRVQLLRGLDDCTPAPIYAKEVNNSPLIQYKFFAVDASGNSTDDEECVGNPNSSEGDFDFDIIAPKTFPIPEDFISARITALQQDCEEAEDIEYTTTNNTLGDDGSTCVNSLTVKNQGEVTLMGDVYVKGNVDCKDNGVILAEGGNRLLIADEQILLHNRCNATGDEYESFSIDEIPGDKIIFLSTKNSTDAIDMRDQAQATVLYASENNGGVNMQNRTKARAIYGNTINMQASAEIRYAAYLYDEDVIDATPTVSNWREIP